MKRPTRALPGFSNEPVLELRRPSVRFELGEALQRLDESLPRRVGVQIGHDRRDGDAFVSTDPGSPSRVVGICASATETEIAGAVAAAAGAWQPWAARSVHERANALLGAAAWLRERRHEIAALEVRECAKPWLEADADVCEAIDYLEYYARRAIVLAAGGEVLQMPGERNELRYHARGVTAVIAPWNFPLAIPMGMSAGALVTGNAVILKPAEQSPCCGAVCVEALRAGGVPDGVVGLLPGDGAVGAALVAHRDVATIAFTGSLAVGLEVLAVAARPPQGARQLKRVVAEFGGKNCIIVDADADLDEVVLGIVTSAYAYAGQKCSAASRVLVHERVADRLIERLTGAIELLRVGDAADLRTDVPPLIEATARDRLERYVELAGRTGKIVATASGAVPDEGWYVRPTLVADLAPGSPILSEEIFGPLVSIEQVRSVDEALDAVDALSYALTGGLYCRDPSTVSRVVSRSPVGNLYVNRPTTGAIVGRQPFGGNRLSGSGSKAGGPDYLANFVDAQVVTENTLRHGLVV